MAAVHDAHNRARSDLESQHEELRGQARRAWEGRLRERIEAAATRLGVSLHE